MRLLVEQLQRLEDRLREGGGAARIERQHQAGKMTARERITALLDPDAPWLEIGLLIAEAPEDLQRSPLGRLWIIFVPTAPHPFTGYIALVLQQELVPLAMEFHDAMKMEFSAGLYIPQHSIGTPAS